MIVSVEGGLLRQLIRGPEDVGDELVDLLGALPQETVIVLILGAEGRVLGLDAVAIGPSWRACFEFRDVFASVCRRGGMAVIVAHSHTSGLTRPSAADLDFTARLLEAGRLLGVDVVDHIIVVEQSWCSLKESTHLWGQNDNLPDESNSHRDQSL